VKTSNLTTYNFVPILNIYVVDRSVRDLFRYLVVTLSWQGRGSISIQNIRVCMRVNPRFIVAGAISAFIMGMSLSLLAALTGIYTLFLSLPAP
jgi:hypothetical protein